MYVCVHVSVSVCAGVSADVCACVCVSVYLCMCVYLWHAKYKICIFGIHACHKKCKMLKWYYICVHVCPFVCVYLYCVCGVPNIKLVSLV